MSNPLNDYLVATRDQAGAWSYSEGSEFSRAHERIRAVHFHTASLTAEQRDHLCSLPKLEALTFCEDYEHSEESLRRIAEVVEVKGIQDLDFESPRHFAWLVHFPNTRRIRTHAGRPVGPRGLEPLTRLPHLEELSLVDKELRDGHLPPLGKLRELRSLDLGANPELTSVGDLRALRELESLEVIGSPLLTDLSGLAGLPKLRRLLIPHTQVRDLSPLANLPKLETLDLSGCPIGDAQLVHVASLPALKALNLRGCPVSDAGLAALEGRSYDTIDVIGTRATREQILRLLGGEPTRGVFPEDAELASERDAAGEWDWQSAAEWTGKPALGEIRAVQLLHAFPMEPGTLGFLPLLPKLEALDLTGTSPLTANDYAQLRKVTGLKQLVLNGTEFASAADPEAAEPLGDSQIAELVRANPGLEILDLGGTAVSARGVRALAPLRNLRRLTLAGRADAIPGLEALQGSPVNCLTLDSTQLNAQRLTSALGGGFAQLEALSLRGNPELRALRALATLTSLVDLDAGASGVTDLAGLTTLKALRTLTLDHAPVRDVSPLRGLALTSLNLNHSRVDDDAGAALGTLSSLANLKLDNTAVGDACVQALVKAAPPLLKLSLANTAISDASIPLLLGLEGLAALDVSGVWLSDASLESLEAARATIPTLAFNRPGDDDRGGIGDRAPFAGLPLAKFDGALGGDVGAQAWLLTTPAWDPAFPLVAYVQRLLRDPRANEVKALVIGSWENPAESPCEEALAALAAGADRLTSLEALFIGDMEREECEVSWIHHTDLSPLLQALPKLHTLKVRGAEGLCFSAGIASDALRSLSIECGGLPGSVLNAVIAGHLPNLETLDLCLGTEDYGFDGDLDDLLPLLSGKTLPKLRHLGLKDSDQQDEVAERVASAPLLGRLETLDLSLGTLSDRGANALLASDAIRKLKQLRIHHHFMSPQACEKLEALPCEVSLADAQEAEDWGGGELHRYVAIGE